jgi:hypothetical protein
VNGVVIRLTQFTLARTLRASIQTPVYLMSEASLEVKIIPGVAPDDRHRIEDTLGSKGLDVAGGGGFDDGSESDIMMYSDRPATHLPVVVRILRKAKVGDGSHVIVNNTDKYSVYDDSIPIDSKPWWKFW